MILWPCMSSVREKSLFDIGQPVILHVGRNDLRAVVVEDRGIFGPEREHVFRIRVEYGDDAESSEFEVPAETLEAVSAS